MWEQRGHQKEVVFILTLRSFIGYNLKYCMTDYMWAKL